MTIRYLPLVAALLWSVAAPARAQDAEPHLSDRGRWLAAGRITGGWSNDEDVPSSYVTLPRGWLDVAPSLTYFVRNCLGVGVQVGGSKSWSRIVEHSGWSVSIHALADVRLSERTSLYIMPSVGYAQEEREYQYAYPSVFEEQDKPRVSRRAVRFASVLPLAFHPVPNLAIGFGPDVQVDIFFDREGSLISPYYGPTYKGRAHRVQVGLSTFIGASF